MICYTTTGTILYIYSILDNSIIYSKLPIYPNKSKENIFRDNINSIKPNIRLDSLKEFEITDEEAKKKGWVRFIDEFGKELFQPLLNKKELDNFF